MIDGIQYLKECCNELEIDFEEVFCCGRGRTFSRKDNSLSYTFKPSRIQLQPQHKYVIKYFSKDAIYLCWDLKYNHEPKREVFSANRKDVLAALENNQNCFEKWIEYSNRKKEIVHLRSDKNLVEFLKYIKKHL